jgi:peptidyl-prolyl cis-trans isomerase D
MGLVVGDEEIAGKVRETAAFQENGVFDPKKYREVLAASGIKTVAYEDDVRGELLAGKVRALVQEPVQVAEAEAFEEFRRDKEKVRISLVVLDPVPPAAGATVSEQDARRAFDADPAKYTRPERARFAYAVVLAKDFEPTAAASDAELTSYFEQNAAEFRIERSVRARHILFRIAEDAAPEEEKKLRERAQFVLDKAKAGTDFAALAKEFSQCPSKTQGGDLGFFERGHMAKPFEDAAFSMKPGQTSGIVETEFGYHLIRVTEKKPAGMLPYEDIKGELEQHLKDAKTRMELGRYVEGLRAGAKVERLTPEIKK